MFYIPEIILIFAKDVFITFLLFYVVYAVKEMPTSRLKKYIYIPVLYLSILLYASIILLLILIPIIFITKKFSITSQYFKRKEFQISVFFSVYYLSFQIMYLAYVSAVSKFDQEVSDLTTKLVDYISYFHGIHIFKDYFTILVIILITTFTLILKSKYKPITYILPFLAIHSLVNFSVALYFITY